MIFNRTLVWAGILLAGGFALGPTVSKAQPSDGQSCAGQLTQQLRRFREQCIADLVSYVASQPQMGAKIASESEKYYVLLIKDAKGFRAEAVGKFNFPLMRDETATALKRLGWAAPENEGDNWRKPVADGAATGAVAKDVVEALEAYGLKPGEAVSLTVGPKISG